MITQSEVVEYLKAVKVGELKSLITTLEDELGVTATPPTLIQPQDNQDKPEEQTAFDVVLTGYTDAPKAKMSVIKAIRKITGLGLKESKVVVEEAPTTIREGVSKQDAEELAAALREALGTVEVR
jgi:large subunit ribosomal protein L7/L12